MAFTHTVTETLASPEGQLSQPVAKSASSSVGIDEAVTTGTTNQAFHIAWTNSLLSSLYIQSDQALTIKSNSTSAPDTTVSLQANRPLIWQSGGYYTNPFAAADVTILYVTNASGSTANISIRKLEDATP